MKVSKYHESIARNVLGVSPDHFGRVLAAAERAGNVPDWSECTDAEINRWWAEVAS
jgi:hypothetical protein